MIADDVFGGQPVLTGAGESGDWAIGGQCVTAEDVHALAGQPV